MFSVYGKVGRIFRGSMEQMRQIGPVVAASRANAVAAIGLDPNDQNPSHFGALTQQPPTDIVHRTALAAYDQVSKPEHNRQPLTQVSAVMSSTVITLNDSLTVEDAWGVLANNRLGQAPVVTAEGTLVGLLSRADLMRPERLPGPESNALVWRALLMQNVASVMWTPVPSVSPDTDIRRVARVLLDTGLPGLPVVDEQGAVIGFISRSDILRAVVADPPLDLWT